MALAYTNYAQHVEVTPQSRPIPGREAEMQSNSAGGYGFILDDWECLHRFLILGSEGGTYYVSEQKLTAENARAVIRCIKADGLRVVREAHTVNVNNRAPKTDQQLFVMALCLVHGDGTVKMAAEAALPSMLRTGTHVLHLAAMLDSLGGWGRVKRRAIASWFQTEDYDRLAYQVLKYQQRDGWSMRDLLRVSHPKATTPSHKALYDWICGRTTELPLPQVIYDYLGMSLTDDVPKRRALWGIAKGLPREALPTEALADSEVWHELLPATPPHALLRNLGVLTSNGTLALGSPDVALVSQRLTDRDALRKARVHPFAVLLATLVYKQGAGVRGGKTWVPNSTILGALEDAYNMAFDTVEPTGKRILVAIDVSGSMSGARCIGTPISCSSAAAAVAITLARSEPNAVVMRFDTAVRDIMPVTKRTGIASIERATGGGTDCAAPVMWAYGESPSRWEKGLPPGGPHVFDAFVILTDSETWAGQAHAAQRLDHYRRTVNPAAKMVCAAFAANNTSIIDPTDPRQLGVAGLDANLPSIVTGFIGRG